MFGCKFLKSSQDGISEDTVFEQQTFNSVIEEGVRFKSIPVTAGSYENSVLATLLRISYPNNPHKPVEFVMLDII